MPAISPQKADPPRIPPPTPTQQRALIDRRNYLALRESLERSSILRGLLFLALAILLTSIARAGLHRVFVPGWWRP